MFFRLNLFIKSVALFITLSLVLAIYFQQITIHKSYISNFYQSTTKKTLSSKLDKLYGQLPLGFEANLGQADSTVKFLSHGFDYNLLLTNNKAILTSNHKQHSILALEFVGANEQVNITGKNLLPTRTNYLLGQNETNWQKEITNYSQVAYEEIYSGIDLIFYGNKKSLEYDLIVAPNIDTSKIQLKFQGLEQALEIDNQGHLLLYSQTGLVRQHKPSIYQEIAGNKVSISGTYNITSSDTVGFSLGDYDHNQPLIIDPEISYSSYLGGSLTDVANAVAVDNAGNAYIVGSTSSTNFPVSNALQRNFAGGPFDVFIAKVNPTGNSLIYATYLGGSSIDQGFDIAVDSSNNVYITGLTLSSNFPTRSPLQIQKGGGVFDAFVTKLNAAGNDLIYSTYLGGNDDDQAFSIAINNSGNAFIAGSTSSRNFPGTQNTTTLSGPSDGFVAQLNSQGTQLLYSRYLGGNDEDECSSIVIDSANNAYVTGDTFSVNFPLQTPIQPTLAGGQDAFITKLNSSGTMVYSTYLGGSNNDAGIDIAIDTDNNVYVAGTTSSTDLAAKAALQRNLGGATDAFLAKIDPAGKDMAYLTYLGGKSSDTLTSIAVDSTGNVYLAGNTSSTDFPTTDPVQNKNNGMNDVFMSKISPTGSSFAYSTYLGGSAQDESLAMALDKNGAVYLVGSSNSNNFPTTNAFQKITGGSVDAFITKITDDKPPTPDFSVAINPNSQTIAAGKSTSFTISSKAIGNFNQPINFTSSFTPATTGLTASFSSNAVMPGGTTTITINTDNALDAGTFTITIVATAGQLAKTLTATVKVITSDFSISIDPTSQTIMAGDRTSFTVKVAAINGFNQPVTLTTSLAPTDNSLTSVFSSNTVTPDGNSTLTINTSPTTQARTLSLTITGTSDQLVRTTVVTLTITSIPPTPDFSLNINPNQLTVTRKQSGNINININRTGGFSGTVTLTAPDTSAMKVILTPSTQSTSGNTASVSFKIKNKAKRGTRMLTFIGRDDSGRSKMATLSLTIQ